MNKKQYFLIVLLGIVNAFVSPFIFLFFQGGIMAMIFGNNVNFFGVFSITQVHLQYTIIETIIVSFLIVFFMTRFTTISFVKRLFVILGIFFLIQFLYMFLPNFVEQKKYEVEHTATSEKQQEGRIYDFSKKFSITENPLVTLEYTFKGNNIVWVEQTKEFPIYPTNVWDVMLFSFDPLKGKGVLKNISELTSNYSVDDAVISNNIIYWTQHDDDRNFILYSYDITNNMKKEIQKGVESLYGVFGNKILATGDKEYGKLFTIDTQTGIKKYISFEKDPPYIHKSRLHISDNLIVYFAGKELWVFDYLNGTSLKEIVEDKDLEKPSSYGTQGYLFGYGDNWIGYALENEGTLRVYNRKTRELINLDQVVPITNEGVKFADKFPNPTLIGSSLYYVDNKDLVELNLDTKQKKIIVSNYTPHNSPFKISGNFLLNLIEEGDKFTLGSDKLRIYLQPLKQ